MASYDRLHDNQRGPYIDPYYTESTGYVAQNEQLKKKKTSRWIKFGVPLAILAAIIVVVVVVVIVVHNHNKDNDHSAAAVASSANAAKVAIGVFATATNSFYQIPIYPSTTNSAAFTTPTFVKANNAVRPSPSWTAAATPQATNVRPDHPRLIAPKEQWTALPQLIQSDAYLKLWNDTIFGNATDYYSQPPVIYFMDGDSGILDNARQFKERAKAWAYAYRMTNDTKWVDRLYTEIQHCAGDDFGPAGNRKWNPTHFLDTAEFMAGYAIAYDWLHDVWRPDQKANIMNLTMTYGLNWVDSAFTNFDNLYTGWWTNNTEGNWNCVCNNGLTMAALAFLGDDTSNLSSHTLSLTIPNANKNCVFAPSSDGTWSETSDYWYYGSTGHSEMVASLRSAAGSDFGLSTTNPNIWKSGLFHMHVFGATSKFEYGDTGPNKYTATANCLMLYGSIFNHPEFMLFQRDATDAADPWSMFWYDPSVTGAFWDGMPLDHLFDDPLDQWAAMRSSWTDANALYLAAKAGKNQGRQTHNDLDLGDFVIDALGTRWAGELGDGDYRSPDYFSNDTQGSNRWLYYRKATEGQNTILVNGSNQLVTAAPTINYGSSNTTQGSSTVFTVPDGSTAFFTMDLTSANPTSQVSSWQRGVRPINNRKQVLVQDDINTSTNIQWRMHTNATVTINGAEATLELAGQKMTVQILNAPSGAVFTSGPAVRLASDPAPPVPDQPNPGVTVLEINLPAGNYNLQVLFNPQWPGMSSSDFKTPSEVAVNSWTLTSHN